MAIAERQNASNHSSGASTISVSLVGVLEGSNLVFAINYARDGTSAPVVALSNGMTYPSGNAILAFVAATAASGAGYAGKPQIFVRENVPAGNYTVTATMTGDAYAHATLSEVTGAAASSSIDLTKGGSAANGAPDTGISVANSQADEIIYASMMQLPNATTALALVSDYTLVSEEEAAGTYVASSIAYKVIDNITTRRAQWTSNKTTRWSAILVSMKGASAPSPIVGTLAATTDNATLAAVGKVAVRGSLAATTDAATLSATARIGSVGGFVATTDNAMLAAVGRIVSRGSVAITTDDATLSAVGKMPLAGAFAATTAPAVLSATGKVGIAGVGVFTTADATLSAVGAIAARGHLSIITDDATLSATGALVPIEGGGQFQATTANAMLSATGKLAAKGAFVATTDDAVLAAVARIALKAHAAIITDDATLSATGALAQIEGEGDFHAVTDDATLRATVEFRLAAIFAAVTDDATLVAAGRDPNALEASSGTIAVPAMFNGIEVGQSVNMILVNGPVRKMMVPAFVNTLKVKL